jgi:hypothetical protein
VPSWRSRSFIVCLALATASSGCGGDGDAANKDQDRAADRGVAAPPASAPPPIFDVAHIRTALLPPNEVAAGAKTQAPTYPGLTEAAVPACSATAFHLPGKPKTLARQLRTTFRRGYTGTAYIQIVALYPDAAAASAAMAKVRAKAKSCPAKRHFPAKRVGKRKIALAHTDTWTATEGTMAGWTHVRGFEKRVDPPSASKFNVFYDVYDYATRGNVLAASLYWERVAPTVPGRRIADRATTVLTKQLRRIG